MKPIELAPGAHAAPGQPVPDHGTLSEADDRQAIAELVAEGAKVLVASAPSASTTTSGEELVTQAGLEAGWPPPAATRSPSLYGLTTRTRTAVINASILPKHDRRRPP